MLSEPLFNGYMFGGNGYVILSKDRFNTQKTSTVSFSFRTFALEGLMFLMGTPGKDFFSVELKDGKVVFQFELGSGSASLGSANRYNDGNWHSVSASRVMQDGLLKVDQISGELFSKSITAFTNVMMIINMLTATIFITHTPKIAQSSILCGI